MTRTLVEEIKEAREYVRSRLGQLHGDELVKLRMDQLVAFAELAENASTPPHARHVDLTQAVITTKIEPMDESPEGYFAYDTEAENRQAENWIRDQLDAGNECAWCGFVVTAELGGLQGRASLWACSYASREALEADLLAGLTAEARDDLEQEIVRVRERLAEIGALRC